MKVSTSSTTMIISIIWGFWYFTKFCFHQNWSLIIIISNNQMVYLIYEFPCYLPNDFRLKKLVKFRIMSKLYGITILVSSIPTKNKILSTLAKDSLKIEITLFPECAFSHESKVFLKYFLCCCGSGICKSKISIL